MNSRTGKASESESGTAGLPTFTGIFGEDWSSLPIALKKHYANRPYSNDETVVQGLMDVSSSGPLRPFSTILNRLGLIPIANERQVPVTVKYQSDPESRAFRFVRTFDFKDHRGYEFRSQMLGLNGPNVVEVMKFGLCWKLQYRWDGSRIILEHVGYALKLGACFIPLPLTMLLGKGHAEESAVNEDCFDMFMHITHPIWGQVYGYKGRFQIVSTP